MPPRDVQGTRLVRAGREEEDVMRQQRLALWLVGVVAGGIGLSACTGTPASALGSSPPGAATTGAGACSGSTPTVTSTATASVAAKPDLLTMTIGVHTQATGATTALNENNQQAQALIAVLRAGGVPKSDLVTSGLSISPRYRGSPPHASGYSVDDTVTATITNLSSAGALIDAAAAKVGNDVRFEGLQYSSSNDASPSLAARSLAVRAATARARAMSTAAGATLGALCSVSDVSSGGGAFHQAIGYGAASAGAASPVPLQAGAQQVSATVRVTYALR